VALVFCTLNFFAVSDLKASLTWAMGVLFCGPGLVIVKTGSWQQMQTQDLLREIRRLELRWLASLDKGVRKQNLDSDQSPWRAFWALSLHSCSIELGLPNSVRFYGTARKRLVDRSRPTLFN
jgi:hypothetical protein